MKVGDVLNSDANTSSYGKCACTVKLSYPSHLLRPNNPGTSLSIFFLSLFLSVNSFRLGTRCSSELQTRSYVPVSRCHVSQIKPAYDKLLRGPAS